MITACRQGCQLGGTGPGVRLFEIAEGAQTLRFGRAQRFDRGYPSPLLQRGPQGLVGFHQLRQSPVQLAQPLGVLFGQIVGLFGVGFEIEQPPQFLPPAQLRFQAIYDDRPGMGAGGDRLISRPAAQGPAGESVHRPTGQGFTSRGTLITGS